jgi:hypothetical protein
VDWVSETLKTWFSTAPKSKHLPFVSALTFINASYETKTSEHAYSFVGKGQFEFHIDPYATTSLAFLISGKKYVFGVDWKDVEVGHLQSTFNSLCRSCFSTGLLLLVTSMEQL